MYFKNYIYYHLKSTTLHEGVDFTTVADMSSSAKFLATLKVTSSKF